MKTRELLDYVKGKGYEVSEQTLRLWEKNIPLPKGVVHRGGRGIGNVKEHPEGVEEMVLDIARWQAGGVRTYDALAWLAWLTGYPIPPERMREIFSRAYDTVMTVNIDRLTVRDLTLWILRMICEIPKHKARLMEFTQFISEYLTDEAVAVTAKSGPEYEVMLREKETDELRAEMNMNIEKIFDKAIRDNHPLAVMNFPMVPGFNMRTVLKLFFRFRMEYFLSNGIKALIKLNIPESIKSISDDEITDIQRYVQPKVGEIDKILDDPDISQSFNFRDPVYSLFIPVIWGLSQIQELSEIWKVVDEEFTISEEPWFNKNPNKTSKQLI